MFDIGFWELTLLAVIGLIVLGPERLPVVARTLGLWVGRAKGYVRGITSELEREVRVDDLRAEVRRTRERIESDTRGAIEPARDALPAERPSVTPDTAQASSEGDKTQTADAGHDSAPAESAPAGQANAPKAAARSDDKTDSARE